MLNLTALPLSTDSGTVDYILRSGTELLKSFNKEGLVQVQKTVNRKGKTHLQNFWVRPSQVKVPSKSKVSAESKVRVKQFHASCKDNTEFLQQLKDLGVQWKESIHQGINLMRAKMALSLMIENGFEVGKQKSSKKDINPVTSEADHSNHHIKYPPVGDNVIVCTDAYEATTDGYFGWDFEAFYKWQNDITPEEHAIVENYTYQYDSLMNGYLRGNLYDSVSTADRTKYKEYAKILQKAIDKFDLPDDIQVYRVMKAMDVSIFKNAPNGIWQDNGFASTSIVPDGYVKTSTELAKEDKSDDTDGKDSTVILNIKVPKGKGVGAWIAPLSQYNTEYEFLLNRGTQFKVEKIHYKGDKIYTIDLVAVGRDTTPVDELVQKSISSARIHKSRLRKFMWDASDLKLIGYSND